MIDCHLHIWDQEKVEYEWLKKTKGILSENYVFENISPILAQQKVEKCILVQAANTIEETQYMLEVAKANPQIAGIVAWLPLTNSVYTAKIIEKYKLESKIIAIRHLIHDEADEKWLMQAEVLKSLEILAQNNFPFEIVANKKGHYECVKHIAQNIPTLKLVLDHLMNPYYYGQNTGTWESDFRDLAQFPNIYAKISGLGINVPDLENWSAENIKPYIKTAIEAFGIKRLCWGGDWPVALLAGDYKRNFDAVFFVLNDLLSSDDINQITNLTPNEFYGKVL